MARKRSRNSSGGGKKAAPGATINKIESYEDTLEEGGVDDFMFKRDQISFNPQNDSDDDDVNGEVGDEVLGLSVPSRRRDDNEEEEEDFDEDEDDAPLPKQRKAKAKADLSTKGRYGKEEVDSDEEEEEDDGSDASGSGSEIDDEEGWGRQYYSRPSTRREKETDAYDEKREEERELEEKEVRRLQRRAREAMGGDDWGLDDIEVEHASAVKEDDEAPAPVAAPETDDRDVLLRHMQTHEPLKLALARDFSLVLRKLKKTARGIKAMEAEAEGEESLHKGLGWLHYQTLLTYATTLAFYIHLCALPPSERPDLSNHPILPRLLQLKEGVSALQDLDFAAGSVSDAGPELFIRDGLGEDDEDEDEDEFQNLLQAKRELMARMNAGAGEDDDDDEEIDEEADAENLWHQAGLEDDELADLLADQQEAAAAPKKEKKEKKEKKRGRKDKAKAKAIEVDEDDKDVTPTATFTPMAEPDFAPSTKKSRKAAETFVVEDTLGDATSLADADAADKEHKKRTLRFHTSKIAATSARRSAARDRRMGGDDDIPYRDRQAARDAALRKNAPKGDGGEDLDGSDWTESDRKRAREVREEADEAAEDAEDDGYYDLVKRRKVAKELAKADAHETFREAKFTAFEGFDEEADGPRALTRAIEKNRGLTPRRSKTGRNPRVKKRQAYEKAKQKVGSQRAVYKGGQAALSGSYSGEKTGISTTIKSRKF
ncbi:something about silencing protein 10 [Vanrija albida]|uniref:Something about silencing protein 10 n=1 Tax=Vanrija albida TaxID=181172 RepID=A0ABR3QFC6_9TREE